MDQRACKELEETGTVRQNKTDRQEGRTEGWQMEMEGKGGAGRMRRRGSGGSRLSECHQLDPPERRPGRAALQEELWNKCTEHDMHIDVHG